MFCSRVVERVVAQVAAVLDLQLETADGAQALHRRRREDRDEGVLDLGELAVQLAGDRLPDMLGVVALVERLQGRRTRCRRSGVGEAVDRQAGEGDAFCTPGDASARCRSCCLMHRLGAVQRGAIRQLGEGDQVLLVLRRARSRSGRSGSRSRSAAAGRRRHEQRDRAAADDPADAAGIRCGGACRRSG